MLRAIGVKVRSAGFAILACMLVLAAARPVQAQSTAEILKRMEKLEAEVKELRAELAKKTETPAPALAPVAMAPAPAKPGATQAAAAAPALDPPKTVHSGEKQVELTISGQVDRGVLYTADGAKAGFNQVDNDASSSRVRWVGKATFDENWSAGTQIEADFRQNAPSRINQNTTATGSDAGFRIRKTEAYFDNRYAGRLWLGFGDTASNTTSEQTLSGTDLVSYSGASGNDGIAGGFLFRNKVGNAVVKGPGGLSTITIGSVFDQLDGLSRQNRIRYDTPNIQGASLSASALGDGAWDVAGYYHAKLFGQVEVLGSVAYSTPTSVLSGVADRANGSISLLHTPTGISATFASGRDTFDSGTGRNNDRSFRSFQIGWQHQFFDFGKTFAALDIFQGSNEGVDGDYALSLGGGLVQKVDPLSTDLYVGARNFSYSRSNANFADIQAVITGARVKF